MQDEVRGVYYEVGAVQVQGIDPERSKSAGVEFFIRNLSKSFSFGGVIFSTFESKSMRKINVSQYLGVVHVLNPSIYVVSLVWVLVFRPMLSLIFI